MTPLTPAPWKWWCPRPGGARVDVTVGRTPQRYWGSGRDRDPEGRRGEERWERCGKLNACTARPERGAGSLLLCGGLLLSVITTQLSSDLLALSVGAQ